MMRRWMIRASFCGALACLSASVLWAKPGILKLRDGRTLEGDVVEKDDQVTITIAGIPSNIPRDTIASVQYVGSVEDQYKKKLAALGKNPTSKDHLDLAKWLFDARSYELARKEADEALKLDPNNADANTLYSTIQSQLRMDRNKLPPGTGTGTTAAKPPVATRPGPVTSSDPAAAHTASMHKYITPDDINSLKQSEWTRDDNAVKVSFNGDVKKRYLATSQENAATFNALSASAQARAILEKGTADERKDVKIVNDPAIFTEYKRSIQPMILNGCATAGCHGGASGGKLFLYGAPENDAASYTNFYLMTQMTANVNGAKRMMIDRSYPESSLITEFGLPSQISKVSHPEVKGVTWKPLFRTSDDAQYKALVKWMNKLVTPEPSYGFQFSIEDSPATQEKPAPNPPVPPVAPKTK
jgi:hypothetical protein